MASFISVKLCNAIAAMQYMHLHVAPRHDGIHTVQRLATAGPMKKPRAHL